MKNLQDRLTQANSHLAPYAVKHEGNLGRLHGEEPDPTRFPFQRDRDRIIHTQAFRRLKGKSQVFVASKGDHYRTRLTHTMEVAQISRDMARTLGVNEDLAECIALAHDLGHTPFGHAGEDAMREEMEKRGSTFEHNLQSLRVVTLLEERTNKYPGLNLNQEVLEGMMKHRTSFDQKNKDDIPRSPSLEAQIVNLADEIAYTAHDVDDGLRSEIITIEELNGIPLFREALEEAKKEGTEVRGVLIHMLVLDAYSEAEKRLTANKIKTLEDVYEAKTDIVTFSESTRSQLDPLREFLLENFYKSESVLRSSKRGKEVIHKLFELYEKSPPEKVLELQTKTGSDVHEAIKDYIAGMTDQYAFDKKNTGSTASP